MAEEVGHKMVIENYETGHTVCSCGQWTWEWKRYRQAWVPKREDVQESAEKAFASHLEYLDYEFPTRVPCCNCMKPTTRDETYGNLCYRCIRADNE